MNENDYYLMMNPVMLTKQEVEELKALLKKVDEAEAKAKVDEED